MDNLSMKIVENRLVYYLVGDYYLPALDLIEDDRPIGHWGQIHRDYLQECKPALFGELLQAGRLHSYLTVLNEQAEARLEVIIRQMKEAEGVTEVLKAQDQMTWVQRMNSIRNRAEECVLHELIFQ